MLSIEKKILIFFTLFLSLVISFHLGENSSGGSKHDYLNTEIYINAFKIDFFSGLEIFKSRGEMHSPFFYIIVANLNKIFGDTFVKYFYLIISSLIPLIFYMSLKKKFLRTNFDYLFFLSLLIFLSPYFRSSAVWLTTDNLALLFFLLSINSFLKFEISKNNFIRDAIFCFIFLILASYVRYYYSIFFLLFFFMMQKKLNFKENLFIILFNSILSVPVILYFLYIIDDESLEQSFHYVGVDFVFNILVFTSLFLFYFIPFTFNSYGIEYFKKKFFIKKKTFLLSISLSLLIYVFYNIPITSFGGGVFYKISEIFHSKLFYIFAFFGLLFLVIYNENNFKNYFIYIILIIMFPLNIIYQKYYDPLIYILIFTLIDSKFVNELIKDKNFKILIVFGYYLTFLIGSNLYYHFT